MSEVVAQVVDPEALIARVMSPPFERDPYAVVNRLRELAPMHKSALGFWCASDHASCHDVFRSPSVGQGFNSARIEHDPRFGKAGPYRCSGAMLPFMDPPDHTRVRQILAPYFTPRAIEGSRADTQHLVDSLLDRFAAEGGGDSSPTSPSTSRWRSCAAARRHRRVDQDRCRAWADGLVEAVHPVCTEEMMRHADDAALGFRAYFRDLVARSDGHGDDLMGRLVAEQAAGTLDGDEFLANATTLVGAAYHNTQPTSRTGIFTLLRHPDQLRILQQDPGLARAANEELLRFELRCS